MTTPAEQYRALVTRLESIVNELKIGDIDPKNGKKILSAMTDREGNVVRSGTGEIWNVKYGEPDKTPEPAAEPAREPEKPTPTPAKEPEKVEPAKEPEKKEEPPAPAPTPTPTPAPEPKPEEKCGPDVKEKIKQQTSFNAAFAMARKAECPDFEWCQIVNVPGQAPTPVPKPQGKVDFVGQQTPLGGDSENPMSFAPNSGFGAEEGFESDGYILEDELDRVREIAGTQVVMNEADIPQIKAATKEKAIEIARKKGIKKFRFCGKYGTNLAKNKPPKQLPTPEPKKTSSVQPRLYSQGPSDQTLKGAPKASQDLIRKSYDDSSGAGGAAG